MDISLPAWLFRLWLKLYCNMSVEVIPRSECIDSLHQRSRFGFDRAFIFVLSHPALNKYRRYLRVILRRHSFSMGFILCVLPSCSFLSSFIIKTVIQLVSHCHGLFRNIYIIDSLDKSHDNWSYPY